MIIKSLTATMLIGLCGHAMAKGCPPIETASIKQTTVPFHMIMDQVEGPAEGAGHHELIQTENTTYFLIKQKWMAIPYDREERVKEKKETFDDQNISCQVVGSETIDGETTKHYTAQTKSDEGNITSADIWISSASGLIVKEHSIHAEDGTKTTIDIRFEYENVSAPAASSPLRSH